ncbi:MAG: threonine synthase, partial [Acidimicrobiia bacterium]|nr:threonine synthase [Acidimicrobiia bacterium]
HELTRRDQRLTIVAATSGDTGSAAIEACRDRDALDVFVLFPDGRVSDVQRRQMTTVDAANVWTIAIDGTFDDCQDLVKAMFADEAFRHERSLGAVNSINWARVMAQIVYYVWAGHRLGGGPVSFCVPTGNFGNVFAGEAARRMGLDVDQFIVASNRNAILTQFFTTGAMTIESVAPTLSPAMDIQVSSNLERLVFELLGRRGADVAEFMARFRGEGHIEMPADQFAPLGERWSARSIDDAETTATIAEVVARTGMVVDPHTAVGLAAAEALRRPGPPLVTLATAHPAKFADAVAAAGVSLPDPPAALAAVADRPERYVALPADLGTVQDFVRSSAG